MSGSNRLPQSAIYTFTNESRWSLVHATAASPLRMTGWGSDGGITGLSLLHDVKMVELLTARMRADTHNWIVFIVVAFIRQSSLSLKLSLRRLRPVIKFFSYLFSLDFLQK